MITIRKSPERGHLDLGWLDTYHSFSFAEYHDLKHMGFRALRVINEDRILPGRGFPTHPHRDMEIITYVLEGALEHRDSMGNGSVIRPGDVQRMTAGTGITHSEYNASKIDPVHLLQIWIFPDKRGLQPGYEQISFDRDAIRGELHLFGSPNGGDGTVTIHQDINLYVGLLDGGQIAELAVHPGRGAWLQMAKGEIELSDVSLSAGDGAAITDERHLLIKAAQPAEFLLFDLA